MLKAALIGALLMFAIPAVAQPAEPDEHATGLIPLPPEEFAKLPKTPVYRAFLPERVDLSQYFPEPGDQGKEEGCTAWAVGYAARAYYANKVEARNVRDTANIPSPGYIYDSIIAKPGDCAAGSRIIDALDLLKNGAFSLRAYPYQAGRCEKPKRAEQSRATDFRIADWLAVDPHSLDQVKGELAKGHPVIISIHTREPLKSLSRGRIYHPQENMPPLGWHAMTAVGYDERFQAFKVINSWGPRWSDGGFGWIGYDAFAADVQEAYVMRPFQPVAPAPVVPKPSPPEQPVVVNSPSPPPEKPIANPHAPVAPITGLECGHVREIERDGKLVLTGFVGSDADLEKVADQAKAAHTAVELAVRPWPQCELLLTLDKALSQPDRPIAKIETAGRLTEKNSNAGGAVETADYLKFIVTTPPYPSYLHAAYIQADGSVINVLQPDNLTLAAYPPSTKLVLGDLKGQGPKFRVSPPFGREMLVVLASRSPVFSALRPVQETEREFLTALRQALLSRPDSVSPERIVSAGYDSIVISDTSIFSTERDRP